MGRSLLIGMVLVCGLEVDGNVIGELINWFGEAGYARVRAVGVWGWRVLTYRL